jgi:hypothetical protein
MNFDEDRHQRLLEENARLEGDVRRLEERIKDLLDALERWAA